MAFFRGAILSLMLVSCYSYVFPEETGAASFYEDDRPSQKPSRVNKGWESFFPQSSENNFIPNSFPDTLYYDSFESNEISSFEDETRAAEAEGDFTYNESDVNGPYGPSNWGKISKTCDGNRQSPININTKTVRCARSNRPLQFDGFTRRPRNLTMKNNGHSAQVTFGFTKPVRVSGGPLKGTFILDNVHWHWGSRDRDGSEHTVNDMSYSVEMHLVTYNSRYRNISEALPNSDGLAVLGFLYELNNNEGATYNPFIPLLSEVIKYNSSYEETRNTFGVSDLIKTDKFRYFNYGGSLTTPNCEQTVNWIVSTTTLPMSSNEIAQFRNIQDKSGKPLLENFRPVQPLNSRKITYY